MADTERTSPSATSIRSEENGLLARLLAATVVATIIAVECVLAYLILPDPQALSEAVAAGAERSARETSDPTRVVEVPLGRFSLTKPRVANSTCARIELDVVYTVSREDEREFSELLEDHENRLRDAIIFIVRKSDLADLTDARLDLIKRRILETSNALLGKPYIRSVVFSEYSYTEH